MVEREVRGEPQRVDVFFEPAPGATVPGLLGRIVEQVYLIEVFHDPPGLDDVRGCVAKIRALPVGGWERRVGQRAIGVLRWSRAVEMPSDQDEEAIAMEVRETYEEWEQRTLAEGRAEAITRLFERKLARVLTEAERGLVRDRLVRFGPDSLADVLLERSATSVAAWLSDPAAR